MNHITINVAGNLFAPQLANLPASFSKTLPEPSTDFTETKVEADVASGFTKVAEDGNHLPADSERTDHVAVIDHSTGLMWSVESLGDPADESDGITQEHCIERCKQLRLLGFDDWRLPTRAELAALVDDTRHDPAIDTNLFPRVKPRWHWTSTPAAWSSASAWYVNFGNGGVFNNHRVSSGFALAVRRASQ